MKQNIKLLLNTRMICKMFIKILKNAIQEIKCKVLIVFDYMIADMISNKKLNSIVTELFIRGRKINISLVFIRQSYFKLPKNVRLNSKHFLLLKFQKRELRQIVINHSSDIDE